jgi:hypothetical protein
MYCTESKWYPQQIWCVASEIAQQQKNTEGGISSSPPYSSMQHQKQFQQSLEMTSAATPLPDADPPEACSDGSPSSLGASAAVPAQLGA